MGPKIWKLLSSSSAKKRRNINIGRRSRNNKTKAEESGSKEMELGRPQLEAVFGLCDASGRGVVAAADLARAAGDNPALGGVLAALDLGEDGVGLDEFCRRAAAALGGGGAGGNEESVFEAGSGGDSGNVSDDDDAAAAVPVPQTPSSGRKSRRFPPPPGRRRQARRHFSLDAAADGDAPASSPLPASTPNLRSSRFLSSEAQLSRLLRESLEEMREEMAAALRDQAQALRGEFSRRLEAAREAAEEQAEARAADLHAALGGCAREGRDGRRADRAEREELSARVAALTAGLEQAAARARAEADRARQHRDGLETKLESLRTAHVSLAEENRRLRSDNARLSHKAAALEEGLAAEAERAAEADSRLAEERRRGEEARREGAEERDRLSRRLSSQFKQLSDQLLRRSSVSEAAGVEGIGIGGGAADHQDEDVDRHPHVSSPFPVEMLDVALEAYAANDGDALVTAERTAEECLGLKANVRKLLRERRTLGEELRLAQADVDQLVRSGLTDSDDSFGSGSDKDAELKAIKEEEQGTH